MNSLFSFSLTGCFIKAKNSSLPYYLPIVGERTDEFMPFPRESEVKCKQSLGFEFGLSILFPMTISKHTTSGGDKVINFT